MPIPIDQILKEHARRYPRWTAEDLYKLIHQAVMGSEHAVQNEENVARYLQNELSDLPDGPPEPLIDLISGDGQILRVHLRPFIKRKLDPQILLHAFLQTAKKYRGDKSLFDEYAKAGMELIRQANFSFTEMEFRQLFVKMKAKGYPPLHHSELYKGHYSPAYRVIARQFLPQSLLNKG
jgi:hypothetical protein